MNSINNREFLARSIEEKMWENSKKNIFYLLTEYECYFTNKKIEEYASKNIKEIADKHIKEIKKNLKPNLYNLITNSTFTENQLKMILNFYKKGYGQFYEESYKKEPNRSILEILKSFLSNWNFKSDVDRKFDQNMKVIQLFEDSTESIITEPFETIVPLIEKDLKQLTDNINNFNSWDDGEDYPIHKLIKINEKFIFHENPIIETLMVCLGPECFQKEVFNFR